MLRGKSGFDAAPHRRESAKEWCRFRASAIGGAAYAVNFEGRSGYLEVGLPDQKRTITRFEAQHFDKIGIGIGNRAGDRES